MFGCTGGRVNFETV